MPENRLIGALPSIGIRPVIDGREEGIRESLEGQTLEMAQAAASFLSQNLRFASGEVVQCVVPDFTIGGVADAARCAELFRRQNVGVSLTVTPCWCYGTEVMDSDPTLPKAIWGFNGTERPGAVYLAAAMAGYNQRGLPTFSIYGRDVQDAGDSTVPEDVRQKLLTFAKAGLAVSLMKGKSYLSIGYASMGIVGSMVDTDFLHDYLGMRSEFVDMSEVTRRLEQGIFDAEEFDRAKAWVAEHCIEGEDRNKKPSSRERKDTEWDMVVKMTLIMRDLMIGNEKLSSKGYREEARGRNAIAGGFQGQRQWTDHYPNGDFSEAILTSSFDWNGIRQPYMFATENDCLNAISMLFGHLMSNKAQIFADVRTFWSPEAVERVTGYKLEGTAKQGFIHLINSGPATLDATARQRDTTGRPTMKEWWNITEEDVKACLANTRWCPANLEYFRGGGYSSQFRTAAEIPVTMCRINLVKHLGPVMQLVEGWTVELPDEVHRTLDERTDPTWPTTWFVPRLDQARPLLRDVYSVMANWGANHGAISPGHIGTELIALCAMLRIPVNMHNVDAAVVFRPHAWSSFGTDPEGADFRACTAYGPRYT
ncbi:MAG: L-fucose isomerase [Bacteroidota bacterium]